jgi:hypothetical protein
MGFASRLSPPRHSIVELIRQHVLDAELAALLWLLVEGRVPIVVAAGPSGTGKTTLLDALLDFLPAGTQRRTVRGYLDDFAWLPEAERFGWRPEGPLPGLPGWAREEAEALGESLPGGRLDPATTCLVVPELSDHTPFYTWEGAARLVIRAVALGYDLAATIHAESLEEVFDQLSSPEVGLTQDERSRIGVVVILRWLGEGRRRVTAAHYVRPVARDAGGHVQRLGPAVLATWEPRTDAFEHFAWGVLPELAERVGRRAGDFEIEIERRAEYLDGLAAAGVDGVDAVRTAIDGYRHAPAGGAAS